MTFTKVMCTNWLNDLHQHVDVCNALKPGTWWTYHLTVHVVIIQEPNSNYSEGNVTNKTIHFGFIKFPLVFIQVFVISGITFKHQYVSLKLHWNRNVILMKFSSQAVLKVVIFQYSQWWKFHQNYWHFCFTLDPPMLDPVVVETSPTFTSGQCQAGDTNINIPLLPVT